MPDIVKGVVAAAVSLVPGAGQVQAFVDAAFAGAGDEWKQAAVLELTEWVGELGGRVAALDAELKEQGKRLEEVGALRTRSLFDEWFRDMSSASTDEKRNAVTNATVRRFDPRAGTASAREHWLTEARRLADTEVQLLLRVGDPDIIVFEERVGRFSFGYAKATDFENVDDADLAAALGEALASLQSRGAVVKSQRTIRAARGGMAHDLPSFSLSAKGRALKRAIGPIGPEPGDDAAG